MRVFRDMDLVEQLGSGVPRILQSYELNVYAKANDASVFHYNDSYGLEVDAIVQKRNGDYAAFEIKLGVGYIDEAAENLKKFARNIDT
ncbi:MAG: DUF4143 domain-containing protein, partial [Gelidibacter sp.]|nr:DUF4143 domain-containing protein [Gelidibacter sp.]